MESRRAEMVAFFQRIVDGLQTQQLCPEEERGLTEFYLESLYRFAHRSPPDEKTALKYAVMGWYVYEMSKQ